MNEHQEHEHEDGQEPTEQIEPRGRGGNLAGIRAALTRPAGEGPAHWGGARPRREVVPVPIDVAGGRLPGRGALPRIS